MGHAAVFLDRDGVINKPVLNPKTQEYEAPQKRDDLKLFDETIPALQNLQKKFKLFVVTNQPDYAKGKAELSELKEIASTLEKALERKSIHIEEYYYCFHHPQGIIEGYNIKCQCRKPSPFFLLKAAEDYDVDLKRSWMVGDRDTDTLCGKTAGCQTILVKNTLSSQKQGIEKPTAFAENILEAAKIILEREK